MELLAIVFLSSPIVLVALIAVIGATLALARQGENSSLGAQRRHDADYSPVRDVYVVLQTTHNYTTYLEGHTHHHDNRSITIAGQQELASLPPPAPQPKQLQQRPRQRVFKVVGEREEW